MIYYYLASKYNYNKISFSNKVLRKKLLIIFNVNLFYSLGHNRYKKFIAERYKNIGLNLRQNILHLELFYNKYLYNFIDDYYKLIINRIHININLTQYFYIFVL